MRYLASASGASNWTTSASVTSIGWGVALLCLKLLRSLVDALKNGVIHCRVIRRFAIFGQQLEILLFDLRHGLVCMPERDVEWMVLSEYLKLPPELGIVSEARSTAAAGNLIDRIAQLCSSSCL